MSKAFVNSLIPRSSVYHLSKANFPISNAQVTSIVRDIVKHTPSAFHSQTTRAVVAFNDKHDKIWNKFAVDALRPLAPPEAFEKNTLPKLQSFAAAKGTVLFFEDTSAIKALQEKFPLYANGFPTWASHSSGAAQILTWNTLSLENVGANLQHYNPLIDEAVREEFGVPEEWQLTAQLVFGAIETPSQSPESHDPKSTVWEFE